MKTAIKIVAFLTLPIWFIPAMILALLVSVYDGISEMIDEICK